MPSATKTAAGRDIAALNGSAPSRDTVVFAGFLAQEDDTSVYIADAKGTWVVPKESLAALDDWEPGKCVPPEMSSVGRPVRVAVRDGSTIHEIRPWQIRRAGNAALDRTRRMIIEDIFTLGGDSPPVTERTRLGERQLLALEMVFARQLGWNPEGCPGTGTSGPPPGGDPWGPMSCGSKTWDCPDGGNSTPKPTCTPDDD